MKSYQSDVIFVPGNEVPHFLQGIKVQIFHGLAGEKKGHFRIRDYFDLYLTQGPYFTSKFKELSKKHKNFDVIETGWCKLDNLYSISNKTLQEKENLLQRHNVKYVVLYAPTFSPSLTSGTKLLQTIKELSCNNDILVIVKFHDKMDKEIKKLYLELSTKNLIISDSKDITKLLQLSDLMISDTSSVVYEFVLLNKPVITLNSTSKNINWFDTDNVEDIKNNTVSILNGHDDFKEKRQNIIDKYHPYNDGRSASRMIDSVIRYKNEYGVPTKRKLSIVRKFKIFKKYGLL